MLERVERRIEVLELRGLQDDAIAQQCPGIVRPALNAGDVGRNDHNALHDLVGADRPALVVHGVGADGLHAHGAVRNARGDELCPDATDVVAQLPVTGREHCGVHLAGEHQSPLDDVRREALGGGTDDLHGIALRAGLIEERPEHGSGDHRTARQDQCRSREPGAIAVVHRRITTLG